MTQSKFQGHAFKLCFCQSRDFEWWIAKSLDSRSSRVFHLKKIGEFHLWLRCPRGSYIKYIWDCWIYVQYLNHYCCSHTYHFWRAQLRTTSGQLQLKTLLLGIAVIQRNYITSFGHRFNIIPGQSYHICTPLLQDTVTYDKLPSGHSYCTLSMQLYA